MEELIFSLLTREMRIRAHLDTVIIRDRNMRLSGSVVSAMAF